MSDDAEAARGPFDVEQLRELFQLMETHGLTEVNLRRGEEHWRFRRGGGEAPAQPVAAPAPVSMPPVTPAPTPPEAAPGSAPAPTGSGTFVKSPTVGTFYSAPSPDDPPFVKVGDKVSADTVVCVVEAMKVFNQIQAEVAGTIAEVLVKDGDAVEYGQPLFRVEP